MAGEKEGKEKKGAGVEGRGDATREERSGEKGRLGEAGEGERENEGCRGKGRAKVRGRGGAFDAPHSTLSAAHSARGELRYTTPYAKQYVSDRNAGGEELAEKRRLSFGRGKGVARKG